MAAVSPGAISEKSPAGVSTAGKAAGARAVITRALRILVVSDEAAFKRLSLLKRRPAWAGTARPALRESGSSKSMGNGINGGQARKESRTAYRRTAKAFPPAEL